MEKETFDVVNKPAHYTANRKYEPIEVIKDWDLNFNLGNTVKYISRAGRKDKDKTIEDLEKARFYLDHEINYLKSQADAPLDPYKLSTIALYGLTDLVDDLIAKSNE